MTKATLSIKRILWVITCMHMSLFVVAQSELTLPTLSHLLESNRYNPALTLPDTGGLYFGFPGLAYQAFHTGPGYRNLITQTGGTPILRITNLLQDLESDNELITDLRFQTLQLRQQRHRWSWGLEHEIVFHAQINYPEELVRLYVEGNQQWIGQRIDIAPWASIFSYNNYSVPISYRTSNVAVGFRPRLLFGRQLSQTPRSSAFITTAEEFYEITLDTDYRFDNVDIIDFEDANLLNYQIADLRQWGFASKHVGIALDLGIHLKLSSQAKLALSVSDLGSISWKDVRSYVSDRSRTYSGVEVTDVFEVGQLDLEGALDSINQIFDVVTENGNVTFQLPWKGHAHFTYSINERWNLSTSLVYQAGLLHPWLIGVIASGEVRPQWWLGGTLGNRFGDLSFGLHSSLAWGSVKGFIILDQLLAGVDPLQSNHFTVRAGINWKIQ